MLWLRHRIYVYTQHNTLGEIRWWFIRVTFRRECLANRAFHYPRRLSLSLSLCGRFRTRYHSRGQLIRPFILFFYFFTLAQNKVTSSTCFITQKKKRNKNTFFILYTLKSQLKKFMMRAVRLSLWVLFIAIASWTWPLSLLCVPLARCILWWLWRYMARFVWVSPYRSFGRPFKWLTDVKVSPAINEDTRGDKKRRGESLIYSCSLSLSVALKEYI